MKIRLPNLAQIFVMKISFQQCLFFHFHVSTKSKYHLDVWHDFFQCPLNQFLLGVIFIALTHTRAYTLHIDVHTLTCMCTWTECRCVLFKPVKHSVIIFLTVRQTEFISSLISIIFPTQRSLISTRSSGKAY